MKAVLYGLCILAGIAVALVVAVLAVPSMIEWNDYRPQIAAEVKRATGRTLVVDGDLTFGVLPTPYLTAEKIRLSNAPGATEPHMLSLRAARIHLRMAPLFSGRIEIAGVELIRPVIALERFSDGRVNWSLASDRNRNLVSAFLQGFSQRTGIAVSEEQIDFGEVRILDGILNYRDSRTGTNISLNELNVAIDADSLKGPYVIRGSGMSRNTPLTLNAWLGGDVAVEGREARPNANAGSDNGCGGNPDRGHQLILDLGIAETKICLFGGFRTRAGSPRLHARVQWEGARLGRLIGALTGRDLPAQFNRPFFVSAATVATEKGVRFEDLEFELDGLKAEGGASLAFGDPHRIELTLKSAPLTLDRFLDGQAVPTAGDPEAAERRPWFPVPEFRLPAGVAVGLAYTAEEIRFAENRVRGLELAGTWRDGVLSLQRFRAGLPGEADVEFAGTLLPGEGDVEYRGEFTLRAVNLRDLLRSGGMDLSAVGEDRLRRASMSGEFSGNRTELRLENIFAELDASRARAAATVLLRARPAFGATVSIDRLDIDAYIAQREGDGRRRKPADNSDGAALSANRQDAHPMSFLAGFDSNLLLSVSSLSFRNTTFQGFRLSGSVRNGILEIKEAGIQDIAGARARVEGTVSDLATVPKFTGTLAMAAKEVDGLAGILGLELPEPIRRSGGMQLRLQANGQFDKFDIDTRLDLGDFRTVISGTVTELASDPRFNLVLDGRHPDLARAVAMVLGRAETDPQGGNGGSVVVRIAAVGGLDHLAIEAAARLGGGTVEVEGTLDTPLAGKQFRFEIRFRHEQVVEFMKLFGPDLELATSVFDQVSLAVDLARDGDVYTVSRFSGEIGDVAIRGRGVFRDRIPRPEWELTVSGNVLPLGDILIAAAQPQESSAGEAGMDGNGAAPSGDRWSSDPIDIEFLNLADGTIEFAAESFFYRDLRLDDLRGRATIRDGALALEDVAARVQGGNLTATATLTAGDRSGAGVEIAVTRARLTRALFGNPPLDVVNGTVDGNIRLEAFGRSPLDLVRSLSGTGRLSLRAGTVSGVDLSGISSLLSEPDDPERTVRRLESALSGGQTEVSALETDFEISGGVAQISRMTLQAETGSAEVQGQIDLVAGELDLHSILTATGQEAVPSYAMRLTGNIGKPDREFDFVELKDWLLGRRIRAGSGTSGGAPPAENTPPPPETGSSAENEPPSATETSAAPGGSSTEPVAQPGEAGRSERNQATSTDAAAGQPVSGEAAGPDESVIPPESGNGKVTDKQDTGADVPPDVLVDELIKGLR